MSKNSTAFTAFLDNKFIPLSPKVKVGLTVLLFLLPMVIFYLAFYQSHAKKAANLNSTKTNLIAEIKEVKAKAANLEKFERELAAAQAIFEETAILLPREKEIPKLLKDISALGTNAGLDFLTFKPQADVPRDFYSEIPISINVRGPYHNMGFFFDQVSKLERIVTVSIVKMGGPKKEGSEMLLNSDCILVTYRFTNVELPKPKKK